MHSAKQSNKFFWSEFEAPCWPLETPSLKRTGADENAVDHSKSLSDSFNFTVRHLKQGATGAVKTWPVAEILLDYLVRRGGLSEVGRKNAHPTKNEILDLTKESLLKQQNLTVQHPPCYNIVELGAGSGFLGVGLSMSLNHEASLRAREHGEPFQPRVKVMCTDIDRATIKNMRFNILEQPKERNVNKAVRVEPLGWGEDIGGEKFSQAVQAQFRGRKRSDKVCIYPGKSTIQQPEEDEDSGTDIKDPIRLLTHVIASDIHYGETTLEPLSSVIAAVKLRNPDVAVIMLLKERSPDAVADLKSQIEAKVSRRLESLELYNEPKHSTSHADRKQLQQFSVSVRDVLHKEVTNMKMVEC